MSKDKNGWGWLIFFAVITYPSSKAVASEPAVECLAQNVWHEARGQGEEGMIAVAFVTMNRVEDKRFPDSVCGVVKYQIEDRCAFSWVCQGRAEPILNTKAKKELWKSVKKFAFNFVTKYNTAKYYDITDGATHYHADYVNPKWAVLYQPIKKIGKHKFYYASKL